jgi:hypothetical protein
MHPKLGQYGMMRNDIHPQFTIYQLYVTIYSLSTMYCHRFALGLKQPPLKIHFPLSFAMVFLKESNEIRSLGL